MVLTSWGEKMIKDIEKEGIRLRKILEEKKKLLAEKRAKENNIPKPKEEIQKPKRGRPKKKSNEEEAEEINFLANKAELKQHLSNSNNEIKNNTYKEGNMMKGSSELKKKNNKYYIDTEFNINNDIDDKVKRALIKSIIEELNKNFDDYEFFYQKKN
jgi:hypothetical protein